MGSCCSSKADEGSDVDPSILVLACVASGNSDALRKLLAAGLNPNIILDHSEHGRITPLLLAVARNDTICARILINSGANVDTSCGRQNTTALHQAAGAGHVQCVKLLLDQGAHTNYADTDGDAPLHMAALSGHVQCALELLKHGANVNAANGRGWSPLHGACLNGHLGIVLALRAAGANVHAPDRAGLKPGALALAKGHAACLALLVVD